MYAVPCIQIAMWHMYVHVCVTIMLSILRDVALIAAVVLVKKKSL